MPKDVHDIWVMIYKCIAEMPPRDRQRTYLALLTVNKNFNIFTQPLLHNDLVLTHRRQLSRYLIFAGPRAALVRTVTVYGIPTWSLFYALQEKVAPNVRNFIIDTSQGEAATGGHYSCATSPLLEEISLVTRFPRFRGGHDGLGYWLKSVGPMHWPSLRKVVLLGPSFEYLPSLPTVEVVIVSASAAHLSTPTDVDLTRLTALRRLTVIHPVFNPSSDSREEAWRAREEQRKIQLARHYGAITFEDVQMAVSELEITQRWSDVVHNGGIWSLSGRNWLDLAGGPWTVLYERGVPDDVLLAQWRVDTATHQAQSYSPDIWPPPGWYDGPNAAPPVGQGADNSVSLPDVSPTIEQLPDDPDTLPDLLYWGPPSIDGGNHGPEHAVRSDTQPL